MAAMQLVYGVDDRVDGLYDENTDDMWYPGRIRRIHRDEDDIVHGVTFEVLYDDGEVEMHVRPEFLRQHVRGTICVGTRVLCRYDGGEEFYSGQISDVQENGRYTIAYDDGEMEEDVPIDHIMEPKEEKDPRNEKEMSTEQTRDIASKKLQEQEEEKDEKREGSIAHVPLESEDDGDKDENMNESVTKENVRLPESNHFEYTPSHHVHQSEDNHELIYTEVPVESAEAIQVLEKRLGDPASTKSVLSTLVKQMRAYPEATANLVHEHKAERLILDALKFHQSHAVIQCYSFVLLRRLCFLCVKSTQYLLCNGIVELISQAMSTFTEDAILQASACGALAVFTRVHSGLDILLEHQVAQLVLSTLFYHKTYSVHTRQVHYYACEVLLELCELDDQQTFDLLCREQEEGFAGDMSPISLLLFLLRQGLSLDDKKACCAVGSLLMCLAASGQSAAALILSLNGLTELSAIMARYPTESSIQKYSAAASKQFALSSAGQSPTKRVKDTAIKIQIRREAESLKSTSRDKALGKKVAPQRPTETGKRKNRQAPDHGVPAYSRGIAYTITPASSKVLSPYEQPVSGFSSDMDSFGYSVRDFVPASHQPSSLVLLDDGHGVDGKFKSSNKRKLHLKEVRQSELFDAYGIQRIPKNTNSRFQETKRAQHRAHLASTESAWAAPQQYSYSAGKQLSGLEHSRRNFMPSDSNRWDRGNDRPRDSTYDSEPQPKEAKRKKKNPGVRLAFQVKVENDNQLRVSRETRSLHRPTHQSPQRLGVATARAAKACHKRATHSSLTGRSNELLPESLNNYATQLFQDNSSRVLGSSRLTPREKEEIRERGRLSFAEKLHKMIDKAKSTLASTSVPVDDIVRPQKSIETARKLREPSVEKRPQSLKSRTLAGTTSKHTTQGLLSPREVAGKKAVKPASRRAAEHSDTGRQQAPSAPVVPRSKPVVSRAMVTPKATTDQSSRLVMKASDEPTDKHTGEREESLLAGMESKEDASDCSASEIEKLRNVDAIASQSSDRAVSMDMTAVELLGSARSTSNDAVKEEMIVASSNTTTESDMEIATEGNKVELPHDEEDARELLNDDANVEEQAAEQTLAGVEAVDFPVDAPQSTEKDVVPDNAIDTEAEAAFKSSESLSQSEDFNTGSYPVNDNQLDEGSAAVEAMYGDAYNEFDDNGGQDQDTSGEAEADTTDAPKSVAEFSQLSVNESLLGSKSGEALYSDGYDDFDEDEAQDVDVDDSSSSAARAVEAQYKEVADSDTDQPPAIQPAVDSLDVKGEQLVADEGLVVDSVKETDAVLAEGDTEEGANVLRDDEKLGNVVGGPPDSEDPASMLETMQKPQSNVSDVDKGSQAVPDDSVPSAGSTDGEHTESTAKDFNTDSMCDPSDDNKSNDDAAVHDDDDVPSKSMGDALDEGNGGVGEQETEGEARVHFLVIGATGMEDAVEDPEPNVQPVVVQSEASTVVHKDEAIVVNDPSIDTKSAGLEQLDSKVMKEADTSVDQEEESKTLSTEASARSVAYDKEQFDDVDGQNEAEVGEIEDENPIADVDEEKADISGTTEALIDAESPGDADCSSDQEKMEMKAAAANSCESSVESTAYNEVDCDDGAMEEPCEKRSVADEDTALEQIPSAEDVAAKTDVDMVPETTTLQEDAPTAPDIDENDKSAEVVEEHKAPSVASVIDGDEDFGTSAQEDLTSGKTSEHLAVEMNGETLDEQQVEQSGFASTTDPSCIDQTAIETLDMETEEIQEPDPVADKHDQNDDDTPVGNADDATNEDESVSAVLATPESSDILSVTAENPLDPLRGSETFKNIIPDITVPANDEVAQEEVLENNAKTPTYDNDEVETAVEKEEASATEFCLVGDDCKDEKSKDGEMDTQPPEQISSELEDAEKAEADNSDDPVMVSKSQSEAETQSARPTEAQSDESDPLDSSIELDKPEESHSKVELKLETFDTIDSSVLEAVPLETQLQVAITPEQSADQDLSTWLNEASDVNSMHDNATNTVSAEDELKPQSDALVESTDTGIIIAPDQSTATTDNLDPTQSDKTCEEDVPTTCSTLNDIASISVDAEDPLAEMDATASKNTLSANESVQDDLDEADRDLRPAETTTTYSTQGEEDDAVVSGSNDVEASNPIDEEAAECPAALKMSEGAELEADMASEHKEDIVPDTLHDYTVADPSTTSTVIVDSGDAIANSAIELNTNDVSHNTISDDVDTAPESSPPNEDPREDGFDDDNTSSPAAGAVVNADDATSNEKSAVQLSKVTPSPGYDQADSSEHESSELTTCSDDTILEKGEENAVTSDADTEAVVADSTKTLAKDEQVESRPDDEGPEHLERVDDEKVELEPVASEAVEHPAATLGTEEIQAVELKVDELVDGKSETVRPEAMLNKVEETGDSEATTLKLEEEISALLLTMVDNIVTESGVLPSTESSIEVMAKTNDQSSNEKEDVACNSEEVIVEPFSEEGAGDSIRSNERCSTNENHVDEPADEPLQSVQSETKSMLGGDPPSSDISSTAMDGTTASNDSIHEVTNERETTEPNGASTQETERKFDEQMPAQRDDADAILSPIEVPVIAPNEAASTEEVVQADGALNEDAIEAQSEKYVENGIDALEALGELKIEVEQPQTGEDDVVTTPTASEGPKSEDQYDNEFDEQETENIALVTIDLPASTATKAPTTEDEYDEYENEEYGEDDKATEPFTADALKSALIEPSASERNEVIVESVDNFEEVDDEAYADDQDDYNNEYEDDDAPVSSPTLLQKDKPSPRAVADDYEDDEYAEDAHDESPRADVAQPAEEEMEEEVAYEEEFADSDG